MRRRIVSALLVLFGFLVGLLLASLDHILPPARIQTGPTSWLIIFVDWIAPPLAGGLLAGALLYAVRVRRLHDAEKAAASVLAERLAGTERRQAIWVVAAAVAHDLKNPLHNLQLLVEEIGEEREAARRAELLARLRDNVTRASDRLAELSRAGRSLAEPSDRSVDLAATLSDVHDRLRSAAEGSRTALEVACPRGLSVRGEAHALRAAVENVAANALEALSARGPGGRLALRAERRGSAVELVVEDDGPGIPDELRARLFTPFVSGREGTGLGLAIARALARAGGGDLVLAEGTPGRTAFRFTFLSA